MRDTSYTESAYTCEGNHPSPCPAASTIFSTGEAARAPLEPPRSSLSPLHEKTTRLRATWVHPPDPPRLGIGLKKPALSPSDGAGGAKQTPTSTNDDAASRAETQNACPPSSSNRWRASEGFLRPPWSVAAATAAARIEDSTSGVQRGLSSAHSPRQPSRAGSGPRRRTSLPSLPPPTVAVLSTV